MSNDVDISKMSREEWGEYLKSELKKVQAEGHDPNWRLEPSLTPIPISPYQKVVVKPMAKGLIMVQEEDGVVDYIAPAFPELMEGDDDLTTDS